VAEETNRHNIIIRLICFKFIGSVLIKVKLW